MAFPLLLAVGVGASMAGSALGGFAAAEASRAQAAERRIASVYRRLKARQDAEDLRDEGERFQARQATSFAKSGVLIDSGSPLATLMDTAIRTERNALRTIMYGESEAEGLERGASALMKTARAQEIAGVAGAVGAGISGYSKYKAGYKAPKGT